MSRYVGLCHVMSRHVTSCHVMSRHVTSCHVMSRHVTSCHVMSRHVTSCHVMSRHVTSCHVMSRHAPHVTSWHVMSRHVISRYVTSCHVTSCHVMSHLAPSCHVMSYHVTSYHVESRGTVTRPTLHCQLTSSTRNQFKFSMTGFVGCPEGCRYNTASAVYDLVYLCAVGGVSLTAKDRPSTPACRISVTHRTKLKRRRRRDVYNRDTLALSSCRFHVRFSAPYTIQADPTRPGPNRPGSTDPTRPDPARPGCTQHRTPVKTKQSRIQRKAVAANRPEHVTKLLHHVSKLSQGKIFRSNFLSK